MVYIVGNFDSAHLYVQWGGKLPGGESWSCGLRMRKKTAGAVDSGSALLTGVGAALVAFHGGDSSYISNLAKLSFVKVNAIGVDGKYAGDGTVQATYADVPGGFSGAQRYPNQVAWTISLLTGYSRGAAHKGRFYVPLPVCNLDTDGRVTTGAADGMHTACTGLLSNLNAVNADYEVTVFSRKAGGGGHRKVTSVGVGRVLDTQRRRRRQLIEDYR